MAPEVLLNKGVRRKADVWSLGCLVLEMASGGNPWGQELFGTDNNFQAMLKIIDPNLMPSIPEQLSEECKDFIRKCLTRDYDQRPSAEDMEKHSWIA
jgi:serine/threonine protein kinase